VQQAYCSGHGVLALPHDPPEDMPGICAESLGVDAGQSKQAEPGVHVAVGDDLNGLGLAIRRDCLAALVDDGFVDEAAVEAGAPGAGATFDQEPRDAFDGEGVENGGHAGGAQQCFRHVDELDASGAEGGIGVA
jgi:hypothetical protein